LGKSPFWGFWLSGEPPRAPPRGGWARPWKGPSEPPEPLRGPGHPGATPRGVDVKPTPAGIPGPVPAGLRTPEGVPGPPGEVSRPLPGGQKGPKPRFGAPAPIQPLPRGGFYINPSRRGPVPTFPRDPKIPENSEKWPKMAFFCISRYFPIFGPFWPKMGKNGYFGDFQESRGKRGQGPDPGLTPAPKGLPGMRPRATKYMVKRSR